MRRAGPPLLVALALLASAWGFRGLAGLGLCDIDGATLLRVSQVESAGELVRLLHSEFRGDARPGVGFHRPLTSLGYAIEHRCFGLALAPRHAFNLLLHLATGILLFALTRRLGVGGFAAALAAMVLLLHPISAEVVPSIARRGDLLATLLLIAALEREAAGHRRLSLLLALAAPLAKESGYLAIALLPVVAPRDFGRRRATVLLAATIALVAWRASVVGALFGGYEQKLVAWAQLPRALVDLLDGGRLFGLWGARIATLFVLAASLARWRASSAGVGGCWLSAGLALTLLSSGLSAWYLYALVPAVALLLAAILDATPRWRWLALPIACSAVAGSPAWIDYPEWREAARWNARLTDAVLEAVPGDVSGPVVLAGIPAHQGRGPGHRFHLRSVNVALGFSVRDQVFLRGGRELELFGAAHVALDSIPAEYALAPRLVGSELAFSLRGPALFSAGDLATERFGGRRIPFESRAVAEEIFLSAIAAPVYYWDGRAFARAPEMPAAAPGD